MIVAILRGEGVSGVNNSIAALDDTLQTVIRNNTQKVLDAGADDATKDELDAAVTQIVAAVAAVTGTGPVSYTMSGVLDPKVTP
jgi:hypothetical protein